MVLCLEPGGHGRVGKAMFMRSAVHGNPRNSAKEWVSSVSPGLFPRFLLCPTPLVCREVKEVAGTVTGEAGPLKTTVPGGCLCLEGSV